MSEITNAPLATHSPRFLTAIRAPSEGLKWSISRQPRRVFSKIGDSRPSLFYSDPFLDDDFILADDFAWRGKFFGPGFSALVRV